VKTPSKVSFLCWR